MVVSQCLISFQQRLVHHGLRCEFRIIAYVSFRIFEIRIEVHLVVGVCGEQEYYPVGTLHYQPVILCYNGSAFCNRFDAESKFHSVIVQDSGIH